VKISERTKAGLERARRRGAKIGRPRLEESLRSEITWRLAEGATPFAVARTLGIDRKTVLKYAGHLPHHNGNVEAVAVE
jgi:DNA invertase Pin-like site-specific DNA recombinase